MVGAVSRAGTEHHELCIGDITMMQTDLKGLLDAGLALSGALWDEAAQEFDWAAGMDRYVIHQVSVVHTQALCDKLGIDRERVPLTFPDSRQHRAGVGPATRWPARPAASSRATGCCCMGIGSGLNAACLEIAW